MKAKRTFDEITLEELTFLRSRVLMAHEYYLTICDGHDVFTSYILDLLKAVNSLIGCMAMVNGQKHGYHYWKHGDEELIANPKTNQRKKRTSKTPRR